MRAEKWGTTVAAILAKGPAADVARWDACCGATAQADQLAPWPSCSPDGWSQAKDQAIDALRGLSDIDKVRGMAQSTCPRDFGVWRAHCQDIEARNAARLQVLVWVLQTLFKMRHDSELADVAGQMADKIGNTLERYWRIKTQDVPINTAYREWCTRVTMDYAALPKMWRYV